MARRPSSELIRRAVLAGAAAAAAALLFGFVVEGRLVGARVLFAVLLGVTVALAYAALRSQARR